MPIIITKQDITKIECDAIVEVSDNLDPGKIEITEVADLPYKHIIYMPPARRMRAFPEDSYISVIKLAQENGYESIAIPYVYCEGTGWYVLRRVIRSIDRIFGLSNMEIKFAVCDKDLNEHDSEHFEQVVSYIVKHGEKALSESVILKFKEEIAKREEAKIEEAKREEADQKRKGAYDSLVCGRRVLPECCCIVRERKLNPCRKIDESIMDKLQSMDKGFSELLLMLIDHRGMSDVECYKRANIGRKTFSKIKCNKDYRPSKATVLSFAIALELNLKETNTLLQTLGMTLSNSIEFDVIIQYFIENKIYNIHTINETLFAFDQTLLGS